MLYRFGYLIVALWVFGGFLPAQGQTHYPPPPPVRQPAEFEPMEGVLIRYPLGIPFTLIAEMAEDTEVVTIVRDANEQAYVESLYLQHGVNLNHCGFLHALSDTHWTRDIGPWFIITGNEEQGIINNQDPWNGQWDDLIPQAYGKDQGIPVYDSGLFHEGGNYMTDGQGTAVSLGGYLQQCNPGVTYQQIMDWAYDYLGVHDYHLVPDATGAYAFLHIDCCAKFLSPDTIMILEVPKGHAVYDYLEEQVTYYENQVSCYGTPYQVVRVYAPNGEPYVNSLILNHKVLVPIMGSPWDDDAIASYQAAMPGYEVLGFTGTWNTYDALHCRTMGITDRHMLYINHTPLRNRPPEASGFPVTAEVIPYSGMALTGGTPVIYWNSGSGWDTVPMTHVGGYDYQAFIPDHPVGTTIEYYIHAEDVSGRSEHHPYIGQPGAHGFTVNHLGAEISALSAEVGGKVDFHLSAGPANGGRGYMLLGSVSGTVPGLPLPGGQTLPLNWDPFTGFTLKHANTPFFLDFQGNLDAWGIGNARFDSLGPLPRGTVGLTVDFAFLLHGPCDFVSNPTAVKIVK